MIKNLIFRLFAIATALILSLPLQSCSDEPESPGSEDNKETPEGGGDDLPIPENSRSVFIYMLADNSLGADRYDRDNIDDMVRAAKDGLFGSNRLIIYHDDRYAEAPALKEVTPEGLNVLKTYDNEVPSVKGSRMEEAIADFKRVAPAERYGLIIWSHATGWLQTGLEPVENVTPQWIGEDRGKYMNVSTLADVLEDEGFDYIYFDCCHMMSVEALYELRHCAGLFAGSCTELPAEGMPYYDALPWLMAYDADLVAAARATFNKYDALSGASRTATMSVVDAAKLDELALAARMLYSYRPSLPADYNCQAFDRPSYNKRSSFYDFRHYVEGLTVAEGDTEAFTTERGRWNDILGSCVIYSDATPYIFGRIRINHHCGLSTYILRNITDSNDSNYYTLEWYRDVASYLF